MLHRSILSFACFLILCVMGLPHASAAPKGEVHQSPPDLTAGGMPDDTRDWRLGPLGANGWVYAKRTRHGASNLARQIYITRVDETGPANGQLAVGDVIVGIGEAKFTSDARKALGDAINEAEKPANKGQLDLLVWRDGKTMSTTIALPVMGSYSATAPFDCEKTDRIIDRATLHLLDSPELLKPNWIGYINGLGLLATGRDDVMPAVRALAHAGCLKEGETLSIDKHVSMVSWRWSYRAVFLCEYYLRTGDKHVLPSIEELATKIAMGQSGAGTWGHTYAARENTGYLHGHLGGYGALNQIGLTMFMALPLAQECGIDNQHITDAIQRSTDFFTYFVGKGTIPYGDHGANHKWFDDNGKSAQGAVVFNLLNKPEAVQFFSHMTLGSAPMGREAGHTGHYWSRLWGGIGAASGGDKVLRAFFKEVNPLYTLERQPSGRFVFQENAGEVGKQADEKEKWDSTGARLLMLCAPRRAIRLTGKGTPRQDGITQERIDRILFAGRLDGDRAARDQLTEEEVFSLLSDPLPPVRSIGARILAERNLDRVDQLIGMLDSDDKYTRYGAAEALCEAGFGSQAAAEKLIELMAKDDDIVFKTYAINALINRNKERGLLTVARPAIPTLLKMAVQHNPDDPRRVLQHDIARALFYRGRAQPRRGLIAEYGFDGVDRTLLIPAIQEILTNPNGGARSNLSWVLRDELSEQELDALWGDIYQASRHIAPSGIMFATGVRTTGLNVMADHKIAEGLDLATWYIRYQKGHGNRGRVPAALEAVIKYGPHAKRVIPELESHAAWYQGKTPDSKLTPEHPASLIRAAIEKINAMPDEPAPELRSIGDRAIDMVQIGNDGE